MSLSESITEIIMTFADKWGISPFEILEKDVDDFILLVNSLIRKNNREQEKNKVAAKDDGFWDM